MFIDSTYIIVFPALLLAFYAQLKVKSTFNRYLRERAYAGLTGAQVARRILDDNGLHNVVVETTGGARLGGTITILGSGRCACPTKFTAGVVWRP